MKKSGTKNFSSRSLLLPCLLVEHNSLFPPPFFFAFMCLKFNLHQASVQRGHNRPDKSSKLPTV